MYVKCCCANLGEINIRKDRRFFVFQLIDGSQANIGKRQRFSSALWIDGGTDVSVCQSIDAHEKELNAIIRREDCFQTNVFLKAASILKERSE